MDEAPLWRPPQGDMWNPFGQHPPQPFPVHPSEAHNLPMTNDLVKLEKVDQEYGEGAYGPPQGSDFGGVGDPSQGLFYNSGMYGGVPQVGVPPMPNSHQTMSAPMDEQLRRDKEAIYGHPLYPLLTCLFERCELATCTPRDPNRDGSSNDVCSSLSFKDDIAEFSNMIQKDKPYYVPNRELDTLMLQSIQMLRFHLLELEKVHELCDNFCNRYVTCLKGKMPMDIVGDERASSSQPSMSPVQSGSPSINTPMNHNFVQQPPYEPQTVPLPESTSMPHPMEGGSMGYPGSSHPPSSSSQPTSQPSHDHPLVMGGAGPTTAGLPQTHQIAAVSSPSASSSAGGQRHDTPLSADTPHNGNNQGGSLDSISEAGDESLSICGSNDDGRESVTSDGQGNGHKRKVPKVFSKEAITKFRAWLFQNLTHPYPSEEQKKQLANDTGLTILQVNNWFINARRRIVQPMIDQSNRAGRAPNVAVFKNRRRRNSGCGGSSTGPSPDLPVAPNGVYSPDPSAAAMSMGYPGSDVYMQRSMMFPGGYPPFPNPGVSNMFMPNMMGFNSAPGLTTSWMDPNILHSNGTTLHHHNCSSGGIGTDCDCVDHFGLKK